MLGDHSIRDQSERSAATEEDVVVCHVRSTFMRKEYVRDSQGTEAFCKRAVRQSDFTITTRPLSLLPTSSS
jgi:hypothetical protein